MSKILDHPQCEYQWCHDRHATNKLIPRRSKEAKKQKNHVNNEKFFAKNKNSINHIFSSKKNNNIAK